MSFETRRQEIVTPPIKREGKIFVTELTTFFSDRKRKKKKIFLLSVMNRA